MCTFLYLHSVRFNQHLIKNNNGFTSLTFIFILQTFGFFIKDTLRKNALMLALTLPITAFIIYIIKVGISSVLFFCSIIFACSLIQQTPSHLIIISLPLSLYPYHNSPLVITLTTLSWPSDDICVLK